MGCNSLPLSLIPISGTLIIKFIVDSLDRRILASSCRYVFIHVACYLGGTRINIYIYITRYVLLCCGVYGSDIFPYIFHKSYKFVSAYHTLFCTYSNHANTLSIKYHNDVIKWKHFPRYSPFERGIHLPLVNFPHKGQWRGALLFSLIWAWINGWVNNHKGGDLRRHRAHYDVTVMHWINYNCCPAKPLRCLLFVSRFPVHMA